MKLNYNVDEESNGKTIKFILKSKLELSERLVKKLKFNSKIFCNSIPVHVNHIVLSGDLVEVFIEFDEDAGYITPEKIDIDIIYEDDSILIINKQPFIVVHPTCSHPNGTIANAIMYHSISKGVSGKIRPVSRLDRDTTGIIIFAKNQFIQQCLIRQMKEKTFKKEYIGVVHGIPSVSPGTINLPIERKPDSIMLRHISDTGDVSITHYEVLDFFKNACLIKFLLETGRTHQIRVHCQAIGHPLFGDTFYSDIKTDLINRQALHSFKVNFCHPVTKIFLEFSAPIPEDILDLISNLKF
jgi:23S rRNA pseudouridine1911/1915/1917 synthase